MINKIRMLQLKARKAKDKVGTNLFTTLLGEFQRGTDLSDPTDDQVFKKLTSMKESIEQIQTTHPSEVGVLELQMLSELLLMKPAGVTADEITATVTSFIAANAGAKMGDVMSALKAEFGTRLDGKLANQIVRSML